MQQETVEVNFLNGRTAQIGQHTFHAYDPQSNSIVASRSQIPLQLTYALTIHRSQGLALPQVIVHCHSIHHSGMLAVACSRVKQSEHLNTIGFNPHRLMKPPNSAKNHSSRTSKNHYTTTCCNPTQYQSHTATISQIDMDLLLKDINWDEEIWNYTDTLVIPTTSSTSTGWRPSTSDSENDTNETTFFKLNHSLNPAHIRETTNSPGITNRQKNSKFTPLKHHR